MQEAGRILLMPKGDYSASATYAMLDLVNHGGASWVCKKDCTGQEPSDSNTEYWQIFGTAVDLSNYLQKSGGTVNNLEVSSTAINSLVINRKNDGGAVTEYKNVNGVLGGLGFDSNGIPSYRAADGSMKVLLHAGNMASHVIPATKGKAYCTAFGEALSIYRSAASVASALTFENASGVLGYLGFDASGKPSFFGTDKLAKELLHTGNKPTGTYTGNGSATERTINIGGFGNGVIIYGSNYTMAIVCNGAICRNGTALEALTTEKACLGGITSDVVMVLRTDNIALNANGVTYTYHLF